MISFRPDSVRAVKPGYGTNSGYSGGGQQTMSSNTKPGASVHLRQATDADQPHLIELVNSAYSVETFLEGTRTDPERMDAMMHKGTILVAEDGAGELLASVYLEVRGKRGYMGMLAVDPARQGTGLASLIVQAAEERLRNLGCEAVDISVLSLRPELLPIYRRFGFVETGTEGFSFAAPSVNQPSATVF
jgi:predicted N-acetyltransferase YhbS